MTYEALGDFNGSDTETFTVTDGDLSDTATVSISVVEQGDAPVAADGVLTVVEDGVGFLTLDATDVDGDDLTFAKATDPQNGVAEVSDTGLLTYTPDEDFSGFDSITFTVSDGLLSYTATVTITVSSVNDAPVAITTALTTDADTPLSGQLVASDADGDDLTFTVLEGSDVFAGDLTLNPGGTFIYTPDPNRNFGYSFIYEVSDGVTPTTAFVAITVNPVNDAPVLADLTLDGLKDFEVTVLLFPEDEEFDEVTLSIAPGGVPVNGSATISANGLFAYTPDPDFFRVDTVTVLSDDGNGGCTTTLITNNVDPLNDFPVVEDPLEVTLLAGETFSGRLIANDADGDVLVLAIDPVLTPLDGSVTLSSDGTFTFTAGDPSIDSDSFGFTVSDRNGGQAFGFATFATGAAPIGGTLGPDAFAGTGLADSFEGSGGNDTISDGGGVDKLAGGGGKDELAGNGGKDLLIGNGGKDLLQGGGGRDTLQGGGGKDTLEGGGGRDMLQGGGGKDLLEGQGGKDTLEGGGGKDDILDGRGSDILTGGGGSDRFIFDRGNGKDTITDFQDGRDLIVIEGGADSFDALQITQVGSDGRIQICNTRVTLEDDEVANFTASDFIF